MRRVVVVATLGWALLSAVPAAGQSVVGPESAYSSTAGATATAESAEAVEAASSRWQPGIATREGIGALLATIGDTVGGGGLLGAATIATLGDGFALVDRNQYTRGLPSYAIHGVAYGVSWGSTSLLELLGGRDVERFPEASATYLEAEPFYGRLDTGLSGLAALRMVFSDLFLGTGASLALFANAPSYAEPLQARRDRDAAYYLGPEPLEPEEPLASVAADVP